MLSYSHLLLPYPSSLLFTHCIIPLSVIIHTALSSLDPSTKVSQGLPAAHVAHTQILEPFTPIPALPVVVIYSAPLTADGLSLCQFRDECDIDGANGTNEGKSSSSGALMLSGHLFLGL